jgi:hypothetical protein
MNSQNGSHHALESLPDALRMISGSLNSGAGLGYARLKISHISRVSSRCCCWSSPTGTCVALHKVSNVIKRRYAFDFACKQGCLLLVELDR